MTDRAAAIARILQATGKCSSNLDRAEFWSDLVHCVGRFRLRSTYGKASYICARTKRLNEISKHAKELARLLRDDEANENIIGDNWREILPRDMTSFRECVEILYWLLNKDLRHLWKKRSPDDLRNHLVMFDKSYGGGVSAFEWLAGTELPSVFRKFFGEKPKFSRTEQGQPAGPFIDFVLAVLREFNVKNQGKPYKAETVAAALTNARVGRPRRLGKTK
jgi:hypothetical protein